MRKLKFIVEKTNDGYSAYAEDFDNYPIGTTGDSLEELKLNIIDAMNSHFEVANIAETATLDSFVIQLDLPQFFNFFKVINASVLGDRIGMNANLIHQYAKGHKRASEKQVQKILAGLKDLGKELATLELG